MTTSGEVHTFAGCSPAISSGSSSRASSRCPRRRREGPHELAPEQHRQVGTACATARRATRLGGGRIAELEHQQVRPQPLLHRAQRRLGHQRGGGEFRPHLGRGAGQQTAEERDPPRRPLVTGRGEVGQPLEEQRHLLAVGTTEGHLDQGVEAREAHRCDLRCEREGPFQEFLGRVGAGGLRDHRGEKQSLGGLPGLGWQPAQPGLEDVRGYQRRPDLAHLDDEGADVVPCRGVGQEVHGVVVAAAAGQDETGGPARRRHLTGVEGGREDRRPQPVQRPPPRRPTNHQRQAVQQLLEPHALPQQRRTEVVVRAADGHQHGQGMAALRREPAEQFLPDVAAHRVRPGGRGQLGQRRPASYVLQQLPWDVPGRRERGHLVVPEVQLPLTHDHRVAVGDQPGRT